MRDAHVKASIYLALMVTFGHSHAQTEPVGSDLVSAWSRAIANKESAEEYLEERAALLDSLRTEEELREFGGSVLEFVDTYRDMSERSISLQQKALVAFVAASEAALRGGNVKYTREISRLAVATSNKDQLVATFESLLQRADDEKELYLVLVDYADGLGLLNDSWAEGLFDRAIHLRRPIDSFEAHMRYVRYLRAQRNPQRALEILNRFTAEEREIFFLAAFTRQTLMHELNMDTSEVDAELAKIREKRASSALMAPLPKIVPRQRKTAKNVFGLRGAYAFSHTTLYDDSRSIYANDLIHSDIFSWTCGGCAYDGGDITYNVDYYVWSVNWAEVIYNEARSEPYLAQKAVAWAVRNRMNRNMNGCDYYPGAEGHGTVSSCRAVTPGGYGQYIYAGFADPAKRGSCVIHGGTTTPGTSHLQMDDTHRYIDDLDLGGQTQLVDDVGNGYASDPTYGFYAPVVGLLAPTYYGNYWDGNPDGAQEWRSINYCASNYTCKRRLGNVGGNLTDPGNTCPGSGGASTDNFFWGRVP